MRKHQKIERIYVYLYIITVIRDNKFYKHCSSIDYEIINVPIYEYINTNN